MTYRQRVEHWRKPIEIWTKCRTLSSNCNWKPESNYCGIPVISSLIRGLSADCPKIEFSALFFFITTSLFITVIPTGRQPIRTRTLSHTRQLKWRKDSRSARSWVRSISSFGAAAKDTSRTTFCFVEHVGNHTNDKFSKLALCWILIWTWRWPIWPTSCAWRWVTAISFQRHIFADGYHWF